MGIFQSIQNLLSRKSWHGIARSTLSEEKLDWSRGDFLHANEISLYLNRAIQKRAEKVGEIEFVIRRGDKEVENHPMLDLLNKPNSYMTGEEFWTLYQKYKDLTGSVYIWKEKERKIFDGTKVKALHLLRPDLMEVIVHDGEIEGYKYSKPTGGQIDFAPDEIIYSHYPDPLNPFFGQSLLKAGTRAIDTEVQISQYHSKILRNGGKIEGVFKFKTPSLTQTQLREIKASYDEQFAGASKSGKPLFLGGDTDYQRMGLTPDELSYLEAKQMSLEDIAILTGVPKTLLASFADVKFDNADASQMVFLRDTIRPCLKSLTRKLDEDLLDENDDLDFIDPTPENKDDKRKDAETMNAIHALTVNEQREIFGFDPIGPEGDKILVPMNLVALEEKKDEPKPPTELPSEEPPKEEPPKEDPPKEEPAADPAEEKKWATKESHPLNDDSVRHQYAEMKAKQMDVHSHKAARVIQEYFNEQEARLIDHLEGLKEFKKKDLFHEIFDDQLEIKLGQGMILKVIQEALEDGGQQAMEFAGGGEFTFDAAVRGWLDERSHLFAKQITETTHQALAKEFAESIAAGESRRELLARINGVYSGWSDNRVRVIANTETHGAFQHGTWAAYKQAGIQLKIWAWAPGTKGGVRHSHQKIDGEKRPMDTPFSNGMMYPGQTSAGASETVSCECTI